MIRVLVVSCVVALMLVVPVICACDLLRVLRMQIPRCKTHDRIDKFRDPMRDVKAITNTIGSVWPMDRQLAMFGPTHNLTYDLQLSY